MPKRPCSVCGNLLAVSAKSLASPTCHECRRAQPKKQRLKGKCSKCAKPVAIGRTSLPFPVCLDCRRASPAAPRSQTKVCPTCSRTFETLQDNSFCSLPCFGASRRQYASEHERIYVKTMRRRARKKNAFVEDVVPAEVFRRDHWVCQLCHEKVDKRLDGNHKWGPTVDHIISLHDGGEHSYANTQLAHRHCNLLKGARSSTSQLRLI